MRTVIMGIAGGFLVIAGIVMLVTPGPGLLSIIAGLALLARRFSWAHGLLARARARLPHRFADSRSACPGIPDGAAEPDRAPERDDDPAVPAA